MLSGIHHYYLLGWMVLQVICQAGKWHSMDIWTALQFSLQYFSHVLCEVCGSGYCISCTCLLFLFCTACGLILCTSVHWAEARWSNRLRRIWTSLIISCKTKPEPPLRRRTPAEQHIKYCFIDLLSGPLPNSTINSLYKFPIIQTKSESSFCFQPIFFRE